jgi:hypothetical protein
MSDVNTAPRGNSPAFPCVDKDKRMWTGMNLRDYIAMEAMHGLLKGNHIKQEDIPAESYKIANGMLEEREKFR